MKFPSRAIVATVAALFVAAAPARATLEPGVWRLRQGLLASGRVDVLVAHDHAGLRALALAHGERLAATTPLEYELRAAGDEGSDRAARFVVATVSDRAGVALGQRIGVHVDAVGSQATGFELFGRAFDDPLDALLATFEDPRRPGLPVTLLFGNSADALAAVFPRARIGWRPSLTVWRGGELALQVPLHVDGPPRGDELIDFEARRDALADELATLGLPGVDSYWTSDVVPQRVRPFGQAMVLARQRVVSWFGGDARSASATNVLVVGSVDRYAALGGTTPGHAAPRGGRARAVCAPGLADDGGASVASAAAVALAGQPGPPAAWMAEAIGVAAAGRWWGRELETWVGSLAAAGLGATPRALLEPAAERTLGRHRALPLRAFLLELVLRGASPDQVRALWRGEIDLAGDPGIARVFAAALDTAAARAVRERRPLSPDSMWRGVALVDGASTPPSDFLGEGLRASLSGAAALGADSVVITVQASTCDGSTDFDRPPHGVDSATSDLAVAAAVAAAREAGLGVTLALVPVSAPTGSFADSFAVFEDEDWEGFFDGYEPLVRHYALFAELLGCDALSLGEGLMDASRTAPQTGSRDASLRALKLERWRTLIAGARAVFGGALTYSATLPTEAERIGFWPELDFLGLNVFPTQFATTPDPPTDDAIRYTWDFALSRADGLARLHGRRAFVTAIGFPSASGAWLRASVPQGTRDEEAQRRALGGLADVLDTSELERVSAVHLYAWLADPAGPPDTDRGFSPQGKAAEAELPRVLVR